MVNVLRETQDSLDFDVNEAFDWKSSLTCQRSVGQHSRRGSGLERLQILWQSGQTHSWMVTQSPERWQAVASQIKLKV